MSQPPSCLIAFDIDNCLMPLNQPPAPETRVALRGLLAAGAHLVLASGKPCVYLSGLARGLDIMECSLAGENGAEIWLTSTMPPRRLPGDLSPGDREALRGLRAEVERVYGDRVFFQPNGVGVTAFPADADLTPPQIAAETTVELPASITRCVHVDSVDWALARASKGTAVLRLAEAVGVPRERIAAAGDGGNDLPMLEVAALGVWLGSAAAVAGLPHVQPCADLSEALARLQAFAGG